jgi:hypothetical protein
MVVVVAVVAGGGVVAAVGGALSVVFAEVDVLISPAPTPPLSATGATVLVGAAATAPALLVALPVEFVWVVVDAVGLLVGGCVFVAMGPGLF